MKDIQILLQTLRKWNAIKGKVRNFWYLLEYYCDYDCTCYFSGNCSSKRRRSKSGQVCPDFCQCNAKVSENTDSLMEMRKEEGDDNDESFWTLVLRLRTFSVFCSHVTWQNITIFLLKINFRFEVFSSDNTFYIEIYQCNLYLTYLIPTSTWVFS